MEITTVWGRITANSRFKVLLLASIALALMPLWLGKFYAVSDMRDVYIPIELFFQQELRAGRLPTWQPDAAWGFPVLASGQIGFFYPPLLVGRLLFPIWFYLPVVLAIHLVAAGLGMRRLLQSFLRRAEAVYVGSVSFALSAFIWQHLYHLNIVLALAWLPWQMAMVHSASQRKKISARQLALLIMVFGAPFLIGQFHVPVLSSLVAAIYFFWRRYQITKNIVGPTAVLMMIAIGAFLLASVQILPTAELLQYSARSPTEGIDLLRANQHSYPLYHLPTLLFPRFFGTDDDYWGKRLEVEYGFYIGTIPWLLATFAWLQRKQLAKDQSRAVDFRFYQWLLVISFLLALGSLSPFRLVGFEPSLWIFSAPARWLLPATLALSVLAAFGYEYLVQYPMRIKRLAARVAVVLAGLIIIGNVLLATISGELLFQVAKGFLSSDVFALDQSYYAAKSQNLLNSARSTSISWQSPFTALSFVPLVAFPFILGRRRSQHVVLALLSAELVIIALTSTPVIPWTEVLTPPTTISQLPEIVREKQARIYSVREEGGDTGAFLTNPQSRVQEQDRQVFRQLLVPMIHAQFGIAGIEWPASLALRQQEQILEQLRYNHSYQIEDVALAQVLNIGAIVRVDESNTVQVETLSARPRAQLLDTLAQSTGSAIYQEISPTSIAVRTNAPTVTKLVVRDTAYPGWRADIDGQQASLEQHDLLFRAVWLAAGTHVVHMKYVSTYLQTGLIISLITAGICVTVASSKKLSL
jgi:hypothetical protein